MVTKIRSHLVDKTGQNTGIAAQRAARWTSTQAKPPVVASYQLGSNRNDFAVKFLMTKTIRKTVQAIGLEGLSILLPMLSILNLFNV